MNIFIFFMPNCLARRVNNAAESSKVSTAIFDLLELVDTEPEPKKVEVPADSRQKRGRKVLPSDQPRIDGIHDINDKEKQCGRGAPLSQIDEEVSEKLVSFLPRSGLSAISGTKIRVSNARGWKRQLHCQDCASF